MCFSATASFSAAASLTVIGIIGTVFSYRGNRRFLPFNLLSFFFAIQQFAEAMLWVGVQYPPPKFWGFIFLFFAFFVYPWYFGLSCYYLTVNETRKKIIAGISVFGFLCGILLFSLTALSAGFTVDPCCQHILYRYSLPVSEIYYPYLSMLSAVLYVLLTSLPCFISDRSGTRLFGCIIILSSALCWFVYARYFVSVWCFYAAVITLAISVMTYLQWWKRYRKLL